MSAVEITSELATTDSPSLAAAQQRRFRRKPRDRDSIASTVARESMYVLRAGGLYASGASNRLTRLLSRPIVPAPRHEPRELPVLLLHGVAHNQSWSVEVQRELIRQGFSLRSVNYRTFDRRIEECADSVAHQIRRYADRTGAGRLHVVGHSLGGLVLRLALIRNDDIRDVVATGLTIGTPHRGTPVAPTFGRVVPKVGRLIEAMNPYSRTLRELDAATEPGPTRWISVYSPADEFVPGDLGALTHPALAAENIKLAGLGHYGLGYHERGVRAIAGALIDADDLAAGSQ